MVRCSVACTFYAVLVFLAAHSQSASNENVNKPSSKPSKAPLELGFIPTPIQTYQPSRQVRANYVQFTSAMPHAHPSGGDYVSSASEQSVPSHSVNAVIAELELSTHNSTVHLANYVDRLVRVQCMRGPDDSSVMTLETSSDVQAEISLHWVEGTVLFMQGAQVAGIESCGTHMFRRITTSTVASSTTFQLTTRIVDNPELVIDKYSVVVQYVSVPKHTGVLSGGLGRNSAKVQIPNDFRYSNKRIHVAVNYEFKAGKVMNPRIPIVSDSRDFASTCVDCYLVGDQGLVFKVEGNFTTHNITLGVDGNYKINMDMELSASSGRNTTYEFSSELAKMTLSPVTIPNIVEISPELVLTSTISVSANTSIHSKTTLGFDGQIPFSSTLSGNIFRFPKYNGWSHPKINFHVPEGVPYGVSAHLVPRVTLDGNLFFFNMFHIDSTLDHQIGMTSKVAAVDDLWCHPGDLHHFAFERCNLDAKLTVFKQSALDVSIFDSGVNYMDCPHCHVCQPKRL